MEVLLKKAIDFISNNKLEKVVFTETRPVLGTDVNGNSKEITKNTLYKNDIISIIKSVKNNNFKEIIDEEFERKETVIIEGQPFIFDFFFQGGLQISIYKEKQVEKTLKKETEKNFIMNIEEEDLNLDIMLKHVVENKASDLHISAGEPAIFRVDGEMEKITNFVISNEKIESLIFEIMTDTEKKRFEEEKELDYAYDISGLARFRVNSFLQDRGMGTVFRVIPSKVLTMEDLGMGEIFKKIAAYPRGLVLVTGPTGSGKSTTLAAIIDYINKNRSEHILTVEDPIEFVHKSQKSLVNQRNVGRDTLSFNNALKSALREDPDVILVGELRDLETIRLAMTAAETGHVVFGTLHTNSAAKTIDRIIDVFPEAEKEMVRSMLSESIQAIVSQTLLKKIGGGRVAAHEIMIGTSAIRNLIREAKIAQIFSTIQTSSAEGMTTLDQALNKLVKKGVITKQTAISKAKNPDDIK